MSQNLKTIKLIDRAETSSLAELSDEQLMHIGELALQ
jgi:hypothetical protein